MELAHLWQGFVHWLQSTVAILDLVVCACAGVVIRQAKPALTAEQRKTKRCLSRIAKHLAKGGKD